MVTEVERNITERIEDTVFLVPGQTPRQITDYLEAKNNTVRAQLSKLVKKGKIYRGENGGYYPSPTVVTYKDPFSPVGHAIVVQPKTPKRTWPLDIAKLLFMGFIAGIITLSATLNTSPLQALFYATTTLLVVSYLALRWTHEF